MVINMIQLINLPDKIKLTIIKFMDFKTILILWLYFPEFKEIINNYNYKLSDYQEKVITFDDYVYNNLNNYYIKKSEINYLISNKIAILRFIKLIERNEATYIAFNICKMNDNQYKKFEYLYDNGYDVITSEKLSMEYNIN